MKRQCINLKFHWFIVISMAFHSLFLLLPIYKDSQTMPPLRIELGSTCEKIGPATKPSPPSPPRITSVPHRFPVKAFHLDADITQRPIPSDVYPRESSMAPEEVDIKPSSSAINPAPIDAPELPGIPPHPASYARAGSPISRDGLRNYLSRVRNIIEAHKRYPLRARTLGIEGKVMVAFKIDKDGNAMDIRILKKSPFFTFNRAAVRTISSSSPFPPPPEKLRPPLRLAIRIDYQLER